MKKNSFLSGKGFYIALSASLIAIAAAAFFGVDQAVEQLRQNNDNVQQQLEQPNVIDKKDEWVIPQEVLTPKDDVKDEREQITSSQPSIEPEQPTQKVEQTTTQQVDEPVQPVETVAQSYMLPLVGEVDLAFSGDEVIKSKTLDQWVMHTGVDILGELGADVCAINSGKVTSINLDDMWGMCVIIQHADNVESHYYGLDKNVSVAMEQQVERGQVIGLVGDTAEIEAAQDPHLHLGVKKDGEWIDPLSIIE